MRPRPSRETSSPTAPRTARSRCACLSPCPPSIRRTPPASPSWRPCSPATASHGQTLSRWLLRTAPQSRRPVIPPQAQTDRAPPRRVYPNSARPGSTRPSRPCPSTPTLLSIPCETTIPRSRQPLPQQSSIDNPTSPCPPLSQTETGNKRLPPNKRKRHPYFSSLFFQKKRGNPETNGAAF